MNVCVCDVKCICGGTCSPACVQPFEALSYYREAMDLWLKYKHQDIECDKLQRIHTLENLAALLPEGMWPTKSAGNEDESDSELNECGRLGCNEDWKRSGAVLPMALEGREDEVMELGVESNLREGDTKKACSLDVTEKDVAQAGGGGGVESVAGGGVESVAGGGGGVESVAGGGVESVAGGGGGVESVAGGGVESVAGGGGGVESVAGGGVESVAGGGGGVESVAGGGGGVESVAGGGVESVAGGGVESVAGGGVESVGGGGVESVTGGGGGVESVAGGGVESLAMALEEPPVMDVEESKSGTQVVKESTATSEVPEGALSSPVEWEESRDPNYYVRDYILMEKVRCEHC